jgi:hypothetical protein
MPSPYIAIIRLDTDAIETFYLDDAPNQGKFGGPWGWSTHTVHVQVPDGLDTDLIRAVKQVSPVDGSAATASPVTYGFVIDEEKQAAKLAERWQRVRQLRNEKLKDSDWTQFADVPLPETQKTAWQSYRKALRDFPGTLTDAQVLAVSAMEALEWPVVPVL